MKKSVCVLLLCAVCLMAGTGCAEYFSWDAVTVNGTVIAPEELEDAMLRHQIRAALRCASYGYGYDMVDRLNIIDAMSKVLFDLEEEILIREQAEALGVDALSDREEEQARALAQEQWTEYLQIAGSENGMAFLPAGNYTVIRDDPQGSLAGYLSSFGLTEEWLYQEARGEIVEEKLMQAVTSHLSDAAEEEKLDYYVSWLLERRDQAAISENALAVAEVCLKLADTSLPEN